MPGRGPAPKTQRQRRATPALGDWVRLEPLEKGHLPELDEFELTHLGEVVPWPMRTRLLWVSWMEDPATALWNTADLAYAVDTIYLHAVDANTKASEIRIRMESLGLTPKGRADRRLLLPDETPPDDGEVIEVLKPPERTLPAAV
jgi:hypothetical protein